MSDQSLILSLVGDIYDAALAPERWSVFLKKFVGITKAEMALMGYADRNAVDHNLVLTLGSDDHFRSVYNAYYAERDPWLLSAVEQGPWVAGTVWAGHELSPDRELVRTEFYNDFMRPQNMKYGMSGLILQDGSRAATISIVRSPRAGPCESDELSLLRTLLPHLHRALTLHGRVQELESARTVAFNALDSAPYGVVLLAGGKLLFANAAAQSLSRQHVFALTFSGLKLSSTADNHRLQSLIKNAGDSNTLKVRGGTMPVRRLGKLPVVITVFPMHQQGLPPDTTAIFIVDLQQQAPTPADLLQRVFELTPAESRLAMKLADGKPLRECADELGVAHSTTRTQLLSIFQKTGTSRQSQLVRLLTSLGTIAKT